MRPGYLGNLEGFWFGLTESEASEITANRLTTTSGAAHFQPHIYLKNHPIFRRERWKPLKVSSPRDLPTPLRQASDEDVVDKYYRRDTTWKPRADVVYRSGAKLRTFDPVTLTFGSYY